MDKDKLVYSKMIDMILGIIITSIGLSFMFKSGLGQTSVTAFTQTLCQLTGMKSGTLLIVFNMSCVVIQMLLLKQNFEKIQLLQIIVAWLQGYVVNVICYDIPIFASFYTSNYIVQWGFMISGIFCASFGVAMLMNAKLVRHPFEELCMILSNQLHMKFSTFRTGIDVVFMGVSLILIVIGHLSISIVREGTWVCMILLGKSMEYTFPLANKLSFSNFMNKRMIEEQKQYESI